ncbi:MAG: outer membrane protein assembly factor BamD [Pseudomonadota bacterium]
MWFGSVQTGRKFAARASALLVCAALLAACGNRADTTNEFIDDTEPADRLYNEALANLSVNRSGAAIDKFEEVERQHPYSEFGRRAAVLKTFTAYRSGKYEDAIASGERYVQLYPSSDDAPYALYLVGLSHWRQIPDVTRDQDASRKTLRVMNDLIDRYPESEFVADAKTKIVFAKDQIAGQEMYVGRYYQERREHLASINRFNTVVRELNDTRHVEEALARLTESYFALGLNDEAQTAAAILGHNFPDSQWYQDSFALLQSGGLEPRENKGSALSRIFQRRQAA